MPQLALGASSFSRIEQGTPAHSPASRQLTFRPENAPCQSYFADSCCHEPDLSDRKPGPNYGGICATRQAPSDVFVNGMVAGHVLQTLATLLLGQNAPCQGAFCCSYMSRMSSRQRRDGKTQLPIGTWARHLLVTCSGEHPRCSLSRPFSQHGRSAEPLPWSKIAVYSIPAIAVRRCVGQAAQSSFDALHYTESRLGGRCPQARSDQPANGKFWSMLCVALAARRCGVAVPALEPVTAARQPHQGGGTGRRDLHRPGRPRPSAARRSHSRR